VTGGGGVFSRKRRGEKANRGRKGFCRSPAGGFLGGKEKSKKEAGSDWRWFREEGETSVYWEKKGVKRREEKESFLGGRSTVGDKAHSLG